MEPQLSLVNVTKRHSGRPVLKGVTLDVMPGEVIGLIGENGVGKSTLVNILAGAYGIDGGQIIFEGQPLDVHSQSEALARGIGVIKQDLNVNPRLTVAQAVFRTNGRSGLPHEELRAEAAARMSEHGFGLSVDARLGSLSQLERTLVEMARMTIGGARLVLMDEVGALFTRREIEVLHDVLDKLGEQGTSAIYISHRLAEIKKVSDRVCVLKEGRVHRVVDAEQTTVDEMAAMLLTREQIALSDRTGHAKEEVALSVRGLSTEALLDDIDLDIRRGEVLGLTGPARKGGMNELAEALTGRGDEESRGKLSGEVAVNGAVRDLGSDGAPKQAVAYFSTEEQFRFEDSATIANYLTPTSGDGEADQHEISALREIIKVIQTMNIHAGSARDEVANLSGGDRQKVALQRWMSSAPDILILNHPTRGLDVRSRQDLYHLIFKHTEQGGSAILISSDPSELLGWCDRIAIMRNGTLHRVVLPGEIDEDELDAAMVAPPARALVVEEDEAEEDDFEGFRAQRFLVE